MQHSFYSCITILPGWSCDMSLLLLKQVHGCNNSTGVSRFTPGYQPISPSINRRHAVGSSLHPNPRHFCVLQQSQPRQLDMASKGVKSVIMCVLIMGLILEQVQVEGKSCCKSTLARNCYNVCRLKGSQKTCASLCGCKIITGNTCPSDYPKLNLLPESGKVKTQSFHLFFFLANKRILCIL